MLAIATLLDPSFKTAGFARTCTEHRIKAKVVDMVNVSAEKEFFDGFNAHLKSSSSSSL